MIALDRGVRLGSPVEMLLTRHVRLEQPILAAKPNQRTGRNEFSGTRGPGREVRITSDMRRWEWAFLEAKDSLGLHEISTAAIIPSSSYVAKLTSTYGRNFSRHGKRATEKFESISTGSVLLWAFTLSKTLPPDVTDREGIRPPDEVEFDRMLAHIGQHLGMSEWGNGYGYGRFKIHTYRDAKG